jgi:hypothetical protein
MIAHSPPLPIIIDYVCFNGDWEIPSEDERAILLALQHRDRLRRICLVMPIQSLRDIIVAMDNEFPVLEYLCVWTSVHNPEGDPNALRLPEPFQAPHLRHLISIAVICPIGSLLITTAVGLVTLVLGRIPPSTYFSPDDFIRCISRLPRLEELSISFLPTFINHDEDEMPTLQTSVMTNVTLANLRWFAFEGESFYFEELFPRITTPLLEGFEIWFFDQFDISIPILWHFANSVDKFKFNCVTVKFEEDYISVEAYPSDQAGIPFQMTVGYRDLSVLSDTKASAIGSLILAQVSAVLRTVSYKVEALTLEYELHYTSPWPQHVDRAEWRRFFASFGNVKTLDVPSRLMSKVSHALEVRDGESHMDLFTELREISYPYSYPTFMLRAFTSFTSARQNAGHPVTFAISPRHRESRRRCKRVLWPLGRTCSPMLIWSM